MTTPARLRRAVPSDLDQLVAWNADYCAAEGVPFDAARARGGFAPLLDGDDHGSVWLLAAPDGVVEGTYRPDEDPDGDDPDGDDPDHEHVAYDGYAVLAHSWSVEIGGAEVVLDELYVVHRGLGTGGRAIEALAAECGRRGVRRMFLETERDNARARALYARCGFTEDDSIWMSRDL